MSYHVWEGESRFVEDMATAVSADLHNLLSSTHADFSYGSAGQVLRCDGATPEWQTLPSVTPDIWRCRYCGAKHRADTLQCSQCGAWQE